VLAPAPGEVAYAGRFRGYGEIVIIDHGNGWTSLITNLATRVVEAGAALGPGAPLGRTGAPRSRVSVELRLNGRRCRSHRCWAETPALCGAFTPGCFSAW
jgi:septal ring factor EnvC (AmiA/AmiB activator)